MDYLNDILRRASLTHLCSFILFGSELKECPADCTQWLKTAEEAMYQRLCRELPDPDVLDDVFAFVYTYATALQYTYMQLGAKIGLKLALELHDFP